MNKRRNRNKSWIKKPSDISKILPISSFCTVIPKDEDFLEWKRHGYTDAETKEELLERCLYHYEDFVKKGIEFIIYEMSIKDYNLAMKEYLEISGEKLSSNINENSLIRAKLAGYISEKLKEKNK